MGEAQWRGVEEASTVAGELVRVRRASKALVPLGEPASEGPLDPLTYGRALLARTAMELPEDLSIDEWSAIGTWLSRIEAGVPWWIGDWWAFGDHRYGERA